MAAAELPSKTRCGSQPVRGFKSYLKRSGRRMSRRRRKRSSSRRREFQIKKKEKRETKTHTVVAVVEEAKKNHRKHLSNVPGNYKRQ